VTVPQDGGKFRPNAAWHGRHVMPKKATVEQRIAWHRAHRKHCACRPIPSKLLAQIEAASHRHGGSLRALLSGSDRRSVAQSKRARAVVERAPDRIAELAELAGDHDWLVSMRALDLLEKLAHDRPDWVQPHKRLFIGPLADSDQWEIRLQIVRALPFLRWTSRERQRVVEILRRDVLHPQKFVRAWSLDSLATLAERDASLVDVVQRGLDEFDRSPSKALRARARLIRTRFDENRAPPHPDPAPLKRAPARRSP
jgi:hypothetical protein